MRHRAKTSRDRSPSAGSRTQPFDEAARFLENGNLRVTEAIDRLFAVAYDEDGRVRREPESFAPCLDEQGDELPLFAAGVLEFVDEHVVIAPLEAVAALRKFVHPPEQIDGSLEDVGKVEDRSLVQRDAILRERDREHPPDTAREHRVEVAAERAREILNRLAELQRRGAVTLP